jgi:thiamine-phosphate pyrophosphorylase
MEVKTNSLLHDLRVYVVTDRQLAGRRGIASVCRAALEAGVRTIQLREKDTPRDEVVRAAREILALTRSFGARLFINDDPLICAEVQADGVHLGQEDMPAGVARRILGPGFLVGVSVREPWEARVAAEEGADYIAANLVFTTATKTNLPRPIGLSGVRQLREATSLPLVAIGGIDASNAAEVIRAGADAVAVVSAVMAAEDIRGACASLFSSVREGLRARRSAST